jgi:hypothetical protein
MRTSPLPILILGFGLATLAGLPAPAATPGATEIRKLINSLASDNFSEREQATAALDAAGEPALAGLRVAAASDDAEVRRRAGELVRKIETRLVASRLLTPTKVKLDFKDKPLIEAVGELCKQSGYTVALQDPHGFLGSRKITLNVGEVSFWEAFDLICAKGHIVDESLLSPSIAVANGGPAAMPGGAPVAVAGGRVVMMRTVPLVGHLNLVDGAVPDYPSAIAGAVRIRAVRTPAADRVDSGHHFVNLLVSTEPKIRCLEPFALRIEKAVDDQGQELTSADDPSPEPVYYGRRNNTGTPIVSGFSVQGLQGRLNSGEKASKSLREVRGILSARLITDAKPLIVVDDVMKATGKVVHGEEGGSIKVAETKRIDPNRVSVRVELDLTADQAVVAALPAGPVRGRGAVIAAPPAAVVAPPRGAGGAAAAGNARRGGLALVDDKGDTIQPSISQVSYRRDATGIVREFSMDFSLPAGRQAAKLVYSGGKAVMVEVPFTLKDVPLP